MANSLDGDTSQSGRVTRPFSSLSRDDISTKELIAAFKDVSAGKGLILTSKAGNLARRLGLAPSLKEIEELRTAAGEYCDIPTFSTFCKEVAHSHDRPEALAELFACYDPEGTGRVPSRVARSILQNCGEVLTVDEMSAVLADWGVAGDMIDYNAFCSWLLSER